MNITWGRIANLLFDGNLGEAEIRLPLLNLPIKV